jgi:hypothetical protein
MKIKCPVASCDYIVKGADDGFKHFQNYDEFHKTLHWNWLKYHNKDLADSDMPDTVKFRIAYKKWHENEKKHRVHAQKSQSKKEHNSSEHMSVNGIRQYK